MKTIEEYTDEVIDSWSDFDWGKIDVDQFKNKVSELFEQAQRDAYNEALEDAAEEVSDEILDWKDFYDFSAGVKTISNPEKESILKLKKK